MAAVIKLDEECLVVRDTLSVCSLGARAKVYAKQR